MSSIDSARFAHAESVGENDYYAVLRTTLTLDHTWMPIFECNSTPEWNWCCAQDKGGWAQETKSGTDDGYEQGDEHLNNLNKRLSTIAEMNAV